MRKGQRVVRFWVYLFVASGTGCAGCGNCFDFGNSSSGSCNAYECDGGNCYLFGDDNQDAGSYATADGGFHDIIRNGITAPGGLVSDGVELFYVDNGVLVQVGLDGSAPVNLATGIDASGGLETDGVYVVWSGSWSRSTNADGGAGDAGDGGDNAEDAGTFATTAVAGIYAVPVNGGDVVQITPLSTLPTFATQGLSLYTRAPLDDAGSSALGEIMLDGDGGLQPFAVLSANTGNIHAFALRSDDLVALDEGDIVSVPFDGGGKSVVESDAGPLALLPANGAAIELGTEGSVFELHIVGTGLRAPLSLASPGPMTSYADDIYVVDAFDGAIYRFDASSLATPPTVETVAGSGVAYVAADSRYIYWLTSGPPGAIHRATIR